MEEEAGWTGWGLGADDDGTVPRHGARGDGMDTWLQAVLDHACNNTACRRSK